MHCWQLLGLLLFMCCCHLLCHTLSTLLQGSSAGQRGNPVSWQGLPSAQKTTPLEHQASSLPQQGSPRKNSRPSIGRQDALLERQKTPLAQQQGSSLQHQATPLGQQGPHMVYQAPPLQQQEPLGVHQVTPLEHQGSPLGQPETPSSQLDPMQQAFQSMRGSKRKRRAAAESDDSADEDGMPKRVCQQRNTPSRHSAAAFPKQVGLALKLNVQSFKDVHCHPSLFVDCSASTHTADL